jgi:acyl dehydratase
MAKEQIIPQQFLRESSDLSEFPIIHTWESITWDRSPPVPDDQATVDTVIDLETISVQPKSIGTFVTSQSTVRIPDNPSLLCTVQSTVVVLGISKDAVVPFDSGVPRQTANPPIIPEDCEPTLEWTYTPAQNQALLYRIASGDTNHIHVDTSVSEQVGNHCKAPLLHGLFTLAVAFRGILMVYPDADRDIRQLEARFTQPAFVGDTLLVRLWNKGTYILFQVVNKDSAVVLVDCGCATFGDVRIHANAVTRSRL